MKAYWGSGGIAPLILWPRHQIDVSGQLHAPGHFTPRERAPGTHWIGGWVGPRAVLEAVVKRRIPSPRRESNPRTPIVQLVAQRYTDWAIIRSILKLSSNLRLRLPSGLFPSGFPNKMLYVFLISFTRSTCSAHLILLDLITLAIFDEV
jgi:hypothetical protein